MPAGHAGRHTITLQVANALLQVQEGVCELQECLVLSTGFLLWEIYPLSAPLFVYMGISKGKEVWIMSGKLVGEVNHFYNRIGVAVINLSDSLQLGDQVHFLGRSTDFRQEVQSMQIEHESISEAGKGQEIAMKVERRVRNHDKVYKLSDDE